MEAALASLQGLEGIPAYGLLFALLVVCGVGAPMNQDIVLLAAAALTLGGVMEPLPLMAVSWVALVLGDAIPFHWGHRYGARLLRTRLFARSLGDSRLEALQARVRARGPAYVFVMRFVPGIRTALFFAAGSLKMPYRELFLYDGLAAALQLPLLVYPVRLVGGRWEQILAYVERFQVYLLVALACALLLALRRRRRVPMRQDDEA